MGHLAEPRPVMAREGCPAFFVDARWGRKLRVGAVEQRIKDIAQTTLPGRCVYRHLFRHTFATNYLVYVLADERPLMAILGHSTLTMVRHDVNKARFLRALKERQGSGRRASWTPWPARAHEAGRRRGAWHDGPPARLAELRATIRVTRRVFLPPGSPEQNPAERACGERRRRVEGRPYALNRRQAGRRRRLPIRCRFSPSLGAVVSASRYRRPRPAGLPGRSADRLPGDGNATARPIWRSDRRTGRARPA